MGLFRSGERGAVAHGQWRSTAVIGLLAVVAGLVALAPTAQASGSLPGVPRSLTVASGNAAVTLKWTAPATNASSVTGYVVTPMIGTVAQAPQPFSTTATAQTISGLVNGTTYAFRVAAVSDGGTGPVATSAAVTVGVPGSAAFPAAVSGNRSARVSWWTAPPNASPVTGYVVTPVVGSTALTPQTFASSATSQTVSGLVNGTTYTFRVAAINAYGTGPTSNTAAVVAGLPAAPGAPTALPRNGTATVRWTAPAASAGYPTTGYVVTPVAGTTALAPQTFASTATSQAISGLANGSSYTFRVAALNALGAGATATSGAITVGTPSAVAFPSVAPGNGTARVSWWPATANASPVTSYLVTPVAGTTALAARRFGVSSNSQTITGLANGTTYTFRIAAANALGTGPTATTAAVAPGLAPTPTAVTAVLGAPGSGAATVSWTTPASPGPPVTGYLLTAKKDGVAQAPVAFSSTATSQAVTGLAFEHSYAFTVSAVNSTGTGTPSTSSNSVTPVGPPAAPTSVSVATGSAQVALSWTAPTTTGGSPITGYVVTPVADGQAQSPVAFADLSLTQVVSGLDPAAGYTFTVAAVNAYGTGPASVPSAVVTPALPPPPTAGTIDILGDSIASESYWGRDVAFAAQGQPQGTDVVKNAVAGYRFQDLQQAEHDRVWNVQRPSALVIAMGTNNANTTDGGWNTADEVAFQMLLHTPSASSCVVVVLPGYGPQASAERKEQDDRARVAMARIAQQRPGTILRDWGAIALDHPEYLGPDGVHLDASLALPGQLATPAAADAFAANVWEGVAQCPPETITSTTDSGFSGLSNPAGVAADSAGNLYVADMLNDRVVRVSPAGVQSTLPFTGLSNPAGIAVDGDGNVVVSDMLHDRVVRLAPDGTQTTLAFTGLAKPVGVVVEPSGAVLVADTFNDRVVRLTAEGVEDVLPFVGLAKPVGLAEGADGAVVVTDPVDSIVLRLAPDGTQTTVPFDGIRNPMAVAVAGDGSVVVADTSNDRVVRLGPTGVQEVLPFASISRPAGVAVDGAGRTIVVDAGNNRVVSIPGT